jgi:hypothetical protein
VSVLGGAKRCPHCKKVVSELSKCTAVGYTGTYHCDISMEKDDIVEEQPTVMLSQPQMFAEFLRTRPADDDCKSFAKAYQHTPIAAAMDSANQKALDVWAAEGADAAVKHMFQRDNNEGGGTMSYAEMRSRYG